MKTNDGSRCSLKGEVMESIKRYIRKNSTLAEVVILLVGVILIFAGNRYRSTILISVGSSMVATAIVVFMTDVLLGVNDQEAVRTWGLEGVYRTRGEMNSSCDLYLRKASSIDIIAFGLRSFRDSQTKSVERILRNGGTVRIITMKPDCENLEKREIDENQPKGHISQEIRDLCVWAKKLNSKKYKGKIEIRYHDHQPQNFLFLMNNRIFTGPYVYKKDSQQTISFEYNNFGSAFEHYSNYFKELWNDEDFCSKAIE